MDKKEFLREIVRDFFIITTLINFVIFLLGSQFNSDARFGYDAFLTPMLYAAFSLIPVVITYSPRELTVREVIVRKVIQLVLIEVIVFILGLGLEDGGQGQPEPLLQVSLGLSIAVVYVLVHLIEWFTDSKRAESMTEELKAYQQQENNDIKGESDT